MTCSECAECVTCGKQVRSGVIQCVECGDRATQRIMGADNE